MVVELKTGQTVRTGSSLPLPSTMKRIFLPGTLKPIKENRSEILRSGFDFNTRHSCPLCGKLGSYNHAAAGCSVALDQGRYLWRHNTVLHFLGRKISQLLSLSPSTVWDITVDQGNNKGEFPETTLPSPIFGQTNLRPDMVISYPFQKRIIIMELTCPLPHNMNKWKQLKQEKYSPFVAMAASHGWHADLTTIEIACHGFSSQGIQDLWLLLGNYQVGTDSTDIAMRCASLSQSCTDEIIRSASNIQWKPLARRLSN